MIEGMRMDLNKSRYDTYDELYEYCYRVAGTVALMSMPVMGIDPKYKVSRQRCLDPCYTLHVMHLTVARESSFLMHALSTIFQGPMDRVYKAALALGTANQLTNILRDVGEDIRERNRIYVPLQELRQFNITEEEVGRQSCVVFKRGIDMVGH